MVIEQRNLESIPDAWVPGLVRCEGKVARGWQQLTNQSWTRYGSGHFDVESWRRNIERGLEAGKSVALVPPMGVVVADADNEEAVRWLESISPPGTPISKRHAGSAHFFFRYDPDVLDLKRSKGYEWQTQYGVAKLDFKASQGGYVVAPPSMHQDGRPYTWVCPLPEDPKGLPQIPDELVEMASLKGLRVGLAHQAARIRFGELPGFDRCRSYIGRLCRYSSAKEDVERDARAFAEEVFADRPERLAEHLEKDHQRLIDSMWAEWGASNPLAEQNDDQAIVDLWIASGMADDWVYVDGQNCLMRCEQGLWRERGIMFLAKDVLRFRDEIIWHDANRSVGDRRERLTRMYMSLRANARIDKIVAMIRKHSVVSAEIFDANPWLISFPAAEGESTGVVCDAQNNDVRPIRNDDYITSAMGVAWNQTVNEADEQRLHAFLDRTFPDQELKRFVQQGFGLTLLGRALELHKFFFLYGRGETGKSTTLNLAMHAFGSLGRRADFSTFTEPKFGKSGSDHTDDVAALRGSRLVTCTEIPKGAKIGAKMKALTGDSHIKTREVRGHSFTMRIDFTAWVAGNDRPSADCMDSGVERRLQVIPVTHRVPAGDLDPMLPIKLREPGVLRAFVEWAIEGLQQVLEQGDLTPCAAVRAASDEYWLEMNPIEGWLETRTERGENLTWSTTDAYRDWQEWVTEELGEAAHQEIRKTSNQAFAKYMMASGFPKEKRRQGGSRGWVFIGIGPSAREAEQPSSVEATRKTSTNRLLSIVKRAKPEDETD